MTVTLTYRGRPISDDDTALIRKLIAQDPTASRRAISQKLCRAWNWVQPNGQFKDMVCRGLLLQLHRAGQIQLPPPRQSFSNPPHRRRPKAVDIDCTALSTMAALL